MSLPNALLVLLDRALAEAKRHGHDRVDEWHLALVLLESDDTWAATFEGAPIDEVRSALRARSGGSLGSPDDGPLRALLDEASRAPEGPDEFLRSHTERAIASLPPAPPSDADDERPVPGADVAGRSAVQPGETSSSDALDGALGQIGHLVEPRGDCSRFDGTVDDVLGLLTRSMPLTPLVAGPAGSGRTTFASALAERLASVTTSLTATSVVRIDAPKVVSGGRSSILRPALGQIERASHVAVLDDIETMLGLGWNSAQDVDSLSLLRGAVGRRDLPLVLTIDDSYLPRLEAKDRELFEHLHVVDLPTVSPGELSIIVDRIASDLETHHGTSIPANVRMASCAPAPTGSDRQHPGLAVARLDAAAARAAVRGESTVTLDDVVDPNRFTDEVADLDAKIRRDVIGHEEAIHRVVARLRLTRARADLNPERPDGVFLLAGPTGVGKTALARSLARAISPGGEENLIRLDMSEYAGEWAVSRLTGPQPGFVGYSEPEGWLTTKVQQRPHAVVLLDEIEKAHPAVWNVFLQVFDAGRLTDARGQTTDFRDTIVLMTSNLGASSFSRPATGFSLGGSNRVAHDRVIDAIKQAMPPELINRLDDVLIFDPLGPDDIEQIATKESQVAIERLLERGIRLELTEEAVRYLAETGYDPAYGARHLQRNIEHRLLEPAVGLSPGHYRVSRAPADGLELTAVT